MRTLVWKFPTQHSAKWNQGTSFWWNIPIGIFVYVYTIKISRLNSSHSKRKNIISNVDPDEYVRVFSNEETTQHLSQLPTETDVTFSQWSRVQQEDGKKRMKLINETLPVPEFVNLFICEDKSFREHVKCVKNQQHEQRELKKKSGTSWCLGADGFFRKLQVCLCGWNPISVLESISSNVTSCYRIL